jgi:hypothetical protein
MLFSLGHGGRVLSGAAPTPRSRAAVSSPEQSTPAPYKDPLDARIEAVIGDAAPTARGAMSHRNAVLTSPQSRGLPAATETLTELDVLDEVTAQKGAFRYYFTDAPAVPAFSTPAAAEDAFDALATSMTEAPPLAASSALPLILTYFGQFIDHDITAQTDREAGGVSEIGGEVTPSVRADIVQNLDNLRDGSLGLDSLYGDSVGQDAFATKLSNLMRHPQLRNKMRLGTAEDSVSQDPVEGARTDSRRPPLPEDEADDLLRLGQLLDTGEVTQGELQALPPDLQGTFFRPDGAPNRHRAIIGDGRNDENLIVAQLQVAFLRFHNKLVDAIDGAAADAFEEARRLTRYHYQWLVMHEYLPGICDRAIVDEVTAKGAPLYAAFFDANIPDLAVKLPMPLEFSVAAFRFGHSMVRGAYDHNRFFGVSEDKSVPVLPTAPFSLLFGFTGNGGMLGQTQTQLPKNWVIEWARFVNAETPIRSARPIDTRLAGALDDLRNEPAGVFKRLAKRNLLRGYRLNIPSAEACISAINATEFYRPIATLSADDLFDGRDSSLVMTRRLRSHFAGQTPLWYYILREAELVGGNHLGQLGSHIVANTLMGLIIKDPSSYWNDATEGHRWSPSSFRPGAPIDSLKAMLRFSGLLH